MSRLPISSAVQAEIAERESDMADDMLAERDK